MKEPEGGTCRQNEYEDSCPDTSLQSEPSANSASLCRNANSLNHEISCWQPVPSPRRQRNNKVVNQAGENKN
jgi:hypothetical protein